MSSSDDIGGLSDSVTVRLNDTDITITESYEVRLSYFEQPSTFRLTLGSGDSAQYFLTHFGPNIPFELRIGSVTQFVGKTTGIEANGNASATTISIHGRDNMAALVETKLTSDKAFSQPTYHELVDAILLYVLGSNAQYALRYDDKSVADNRTNTVGAAVQTLSVPAYLSDLLLTVLPQKPVVQGKAGETVYHYLARELQRAGLFLYCGSDGTYILSAPNPNQAPTYRIARQRGATRNLVNVVDHRFRFDTVGRAAHYVVLGRGGGAPTSATDATAQVGSVIGARSGLVGTYDDPEMVELGFTNSWVRKDHHVTSSKQAEFLARRRCAQDQRHAFELVYLVSGHTIPALSGGRAVWCRDTIVDVQDDELGLYGSMWIESVTFKRGLQGTTTEIKLLKPDYLVFGGSDD